MRLAAIAVFVILVFSLGSGASQEKGTDKKDLGEAQKLNADGVEIDFSYLRKTWGLKVKTVSLKKNEDPDKSFFRDLKFSLEFEKDLAPAELKELRAAFGPSQVGTTKPPSIWYYFLDEENVTVGKTYFGSQGSTDKIEGEITGVKGDVFRVAIDNIRHHEKAKKLVARPAEKSK